MRRMLAVLRREDAMQLGRAATWGVFGAAMLLSLLDNAPTAGNLARLEFLQDPAYFLYRVTSFDLLVLLFGLVFLLAGRLPLDGKTGMRALLMATPLRKGEYALGKLLGGFASTFLVSALFLAANAAVYAAVAPLARPIDCALPLARAVFCCALPASLFASFCAVALGGVLDVRLVYALAAAYFGWNAAYIASAGDPPFGLLTAGGLVRTIWTHPRWPAASASSAAANAAFLALGAGLACALLLGSRRIWRRR